MPKGYQPKTGNVKKTLSIRKEVADLLEAQETKHGDQAKIVEQLIVEKYGKEKPKVCTPANPNIEDLPQPNKTEVHY